ncbi:branched-chain amino acid ABC transporter permease [Variovorax sp. LjRoot290]|uniref:branched-chain amino acid ABC transporter permease n=1 Tax=Variovorax sp. LjRoot290 TaxID=3342316 RepID=UPI003ECDEDD1
MSDVFGVPLPAVASQLLLGVVNGSFYALLSLGLTVIFGMLNVVNFCHGALYMAGALAAWMGMNYFGIGYWPALLLSPLIVAALGVVIERTTLSRLRGLDPLYGLLVTFGIALIVEGLAVNAYGSTGMPYPPPDALAGGTEIGSLFLPKYRLWVLGCSAVLCLATWLLIERTRLGARLRAGTENPRLLQAFGVNVPVMITATYAVGVGLAALSGVLTAPLTAVSPLMGSNLLIVVFAVVVIGGMGSVLGSVVTGVGLGVLEAVAKVYYAPFANTVVFMVMVLVLLVRPAGLFGRSA